MTRCDANPQTNQGKGATAVTVSMTSVARSPRDRQTQTHAMDQVCLPGDGPPTLYLRRAKRQFYSVTGRRTIKVVPTPSLLRTVMRPPCATTMIRAMERPKPWPLDCALRALSLR